jgi:hypothetical protein
MFLHRHEIYDDGFSAVMRALKGLAGPFDGALPTSSIVGSDLSRIEMFINPADCNAIT